MAYNGGASGLGKSSGRTQGNKGADYRANSKPMRGMSNMPSKTHMLEDNI